MDISIKVFRITVEGHLCIKDGLRTYNNFMELCVQCCNPNLGLATKARAYKGAGQKGSPGTTCHAPENVRECEGMNPHTPNDTLPTSFINSNVSLR
jgi:hypothetical protein